MYHPQRTVLPALCIFALLTGCQQASIQDRASEQGPPPPGYVRIVGEPVPGWTPADMRAAPSMMNWTLMGPRPITDEFWSGNDDASGRVVAIAPHPSDANTAYLAAASGGIWKTTDGGVLWLPLTDELPVLNHGCLTLDPSDPDTVIVGTGEYSTRSTGDGLFKSTDGGATWARIATAAQVGSTCSQVIVDPADSDIIHVTGADGYHRTTDGGANWSTLLSGRASDLVMDPTDPDRLWAAQHGVGIFRSTDGGSNWTQLTTGLPTTNFNRIVMDIAQTDADTLYAAWINNANGLRGLYKTTDGGTTWNLLGNTPDFPSPQGSYDVFIGVDPTNANNVWGGGVFPSYAVAGVIKSTDGGTSWTDVTTGTVGQVHPDMHCVAFGPTGDVWVGSDGGVWKSSDGGANWQNLNDTLSITQNYQIALHPTDPDQVMGGTQDNGTVASDLGTEDWPQVLGGDGGFNAYDQTTPGLRYFTYVRLSTYRDDNGSITQISGPWSMDPRNFIAPLVMDPNDSRILYGGSNRIWQNRNADTTSTWNAISTNAVADGGTINTMAVAPSDSMTMYTGSSTGAVFVTGDLSLWQDRSTGLPSGQVSDIIIDPADADRAYVSFYNTTGPRLLFTANRGTNWTDVTGALPSGVAARALEVDWSEAIPTLYVGSGAGVYWSLDGGATWTKDGSDLPNVNIGDLRIDTTNGTIYAGTYGRGVWRASLVDGLAVFADGFESGNTVRWSGTN